MAHKAFIFSLAIFFVFFSSQVGSAATPFSAPAAFDLTGSGIRYEGSFQTQRLGTLALGVSPNPAPLTGFIDIQQLQQSTGTFSSAFRGVSSTTSAQVERLGLSFPITITIQGNNVTGIFIWNNNAVIFYPGNLSATLSFGDQSWNIPFIGVPLRGQYDQGVLRLQARVSFGENYHGSQFTLQMQIDLVGHLQAQGPGYTWLQLNTNCSSCAPGENLKLYASLAYAMPGQVVDIYLVLSDPSGNMLFAPSYTGEVTPVASVALETGFYAPPTKILDVPLPAQLPPVQSEGQYQFLAALCAAGTFNLIGDVSSTGFTFTSSPSGGGTPSGTYDGVWTGTGSSAVVSAECPGLARVLLEVQNSQIDGSAVSERGDEYMVKGSISAGGQITDGILLEEFGPNLVAVGAFAGAFTARSASGTWMDEYGCHGAFELSKSE